MVHNDVKATWHIRLWGSIVIGSSWQLADRRYSLGHEKTRNPDRRRRHKWTGSRQLSAAFRMQRNVD